MWHDRIDYGHIGVYKVRCNILNVIIREISIIIYKVSDNLY